MSTTSHIPRTPRARRRALAAVGTAALVVGASITAGNAGLLAAAADPPPIAVEPLSGFTDFTDDVSMKLKRRLPDQGAEVLDVSDPGRMLVARITVQPGARFPWHTHPGPVVVHVARGDLVYQQASDCVGRPYASGTAFLDPGNKLHTAWNPSPEDVTVLIAVFHAVPGGTPPTIPAPDQSDRC